MKRGKHPTTSRKNKVKKIKKTYAKAREDAQLAGVIPTEPVGAVRSEVVDPHSQSNAALPELVRQALREAWATPDSAKPAIIAALLEPFYKDDIVLDEKGVAHHVRPSRKLLMELAKTLHTLDVTQYERDQPERAGQARGGSKVVNNVSATIHTGDVFNDIQLLERNIRAIQGVSNPETVSDVRTNGYVESVDEAQPNTSSQEPEAD